jgi:dTDP-4-amino-4,6-dideoxygalactose transaminase
MIRFNKASIGELEKKYVIDAMENSILSGDGKYTIRVYEQLKNLFGIQKSLLTTSGTSALELAALLIDLRIDDEVIVPSFTFSSTVNAFLLRGARPIFCDINKETYNIDTLLIEPLITEKTRAIYCVDYAGIPCDFDKINEIANRYNLFVIDDAAQAMGSKYHGRPAGTLTEFGCYSFHETKNYVMGEGGAIVINEEKYFDRAEVIREKGTDRNRVLKGLTDKYTWRDIGSSFLPSDILAAILSAQLERYEEITKKRLNVWTIYHTQLHELEQRGLLKLPFVPQYAEHNGHMYNIRLNDSATRTKLMEFLRARDIFPYICYVPLHSAPMGEMLGYKPGDCPITEDIASRTLRLPLYADMTTNNANQVVTAIFDYFNSY